MNITVHLAHDGWYYQDGDYYVYGFPTQVAAMAHALGEREGPIND